MNIILPNGMTLTRRHQTVVEVAADAIATTFSRCENGQVEVVSVPHNIGDVLSKSLLLDFQVGQAVIDGSRSKS